MEDKVLIAVIAGVAAIIGGLITAVVGPFVVHNLRHAESGKAHKRLLVQRWREMVNDLHSRSRGDQNVKSKILTHPDFLTLETHLSKEALTQIRSKTITIIRGNEGLAHPLRVLSSEISRIEREWELF